MCNPSSVGPCLTILAVCVVFLVALSVGLFVYVLCERNEHTWFAFRGGKWYVEEPGKEPREAEHINNVKG